MFQAAREHPIVAALVVLPGVMYLASMFCPVDGGWDDALFGWMTAWFCLAASSSAVWNAAVALEPVPDDAIVYFVGTLANVLFLAVLVLGWKLRGRPGTVALLCSGSFTTALAIPQLMRFFPVFGFPPSWFGTTTAMLLETYLEWQLGYWLWTASFGCAMLVWAGLWWRQCRVSVVH